MIIKRVVENMSDGDFKFFIFLGFLWVILNIKLLKNRMSEDIDRLIFELKYKDRDDENN